MPIKSTAGTSGDRGADLNLVRSFAPIRRQRGVARRVLDIAIPQGRLQRTCVDAILCRDDQSDWWTWSIRHTRSIGFITGNFGIFCFARERFVASQTIEKWSAAGPIEGAARVTKFFGNTARFRRRETEGSTVPAWVQ